jgi:hypothetical protein
VHGTLPRHAPRGNCLVPSSLAMMVGVCPSGDQVQTTEGIKRNPDSSSPHSFYPRPVLLFPEFGFFLIPLQRTPVGFLRAPSQTMDQTTDAGVVTSDSEPALHRLGNPNRDPQIGSVAMREGSLQEQTNEAFSCCGVQLPRADRERSFIFKAFAPPCVGLPTDRCSLSVRGLGLGVVPPEHRYCVIDAHVMQPRIKADTREPLRCRCLLPP